MKIVIPKVIGNPELTSSNITEDDYTAWAVGTTYAVGDRVMRVTTATAVVSLIYGTSTPLAVGTSQIIPPIGTPVTFTTTGSLPTGLVVNQTYYVLPGYDTKSFMVSSTPNGMPIYVSGTNSGTCSSQFFIHKIYESVQAANTGHAPYDINGVNTAWWLEVSSTNRWKMFDASLSSQSSRADSIVVSILVAEAIDTAAFLNVSAATIRLVMVDISSVTVYDHTYNLAISGGILDRAKDLLVSDLPSSPGATLTVTLSDTGYQVLCGAMILGKAKDIGNTDFGCNIGIQDYSVKNRDTFGNYSITERNFSKRATLSIPVDSTLVDQVQNLLASVRAKPTLFIGTSLYMATVIYGFYKDFSEVISLPTVTVLNIEIEGLT